MNALLKRIVLLLIFALAVATIATYFIAPLWRAHAPGDDSWTIEIAVFFLTFSLVLTPATIIHILDYAKNPTKTGF